MKIRIIAAFYKFNKSRFSFKNYRLNESKIKYENQSEIFWLNKTANIENMCGIGELNEEDIEHSKQILNKLEINNKFKRALDVGGGIGRITFNVLYDKCEKIDMLDFNKSFLERAVLKEKEIKGKILGEIYPTKIQNFQFEHHYELIFIQWVLEYLNKEQFLKFLSDCTLNLDKNGYMIIKENVNLSDDTTLLIEDEGSLIRSPKFFEKAFNKIGINLIYDELVMYKSVKEEIYDVKCWVLRKI